MCYEAAALLYARIVERAHYADSMTDAVKRRAHIATLADSEDMLDRYAAALVERWSAEP